MVVEWRPKAKGPRKPGNARLTNLLRNTLSIPWTPVSAASRPGWGGRKSSSVPLVSDNETLSPFWSLNYDPTIRRKKYHLTTARLLVTINPLTATLRTLSRIFYPSSFLRRSSAGKPGVPRYPLFRNEPVESDIVTLAGALLADCDDE